MGRKGALALVASLVVAQLALAAPAGAVSTAVHEFTVSHMAQELRVSFLITALPELSDGPDVEGIAACAVERATRVQRRTATGWQTVTSGRTGAAGWFSERVRDRTGAYRVVVPAFETTGGARCDRAVSEVRRHRH